jgi:beta-xylosidase
MLYYARIVKCLSVGIKVSAALLIVVQFAGVVKSCYASNPIVSTAYSADPSAHVCGDRLYVYASHDRNDAKTFDMVDYHVYSTDDMQNWRDHGVVLSVKDVKWAQGSFWAPDCGYKNGRYYLYFPAKDKSGAFHVGVAIGRSPTGPFVDIGHPIAGVDGIDPSIYIDGDGTPYLIWATRNAAQLARLKPNVTALAEAPHRVEVTDFFEGPWIFKRNGL